MELLKKKVTIHLKVRLYCLCRNEEIRSVFDVNGFWSPLCIQRRNECSFFVHMYMHVYRSIYAGNSGKGFGRQLIRFHGASLVAQWLGIRLPMQGTRVRAPVREDPTCRGAARPVSHNY